MARSSTKSITPPVAADVPVVQTIEPVVNDEVHKAKKSKKSKKDDVVVDSAVPSIPSIPSIPSLPIEDAVVDASVPSITTAVVDVISIPTEDAVVDVPTIPTEDVETPYTIAVARLNDFGKHINDLTVVLSSLKLEYKTLEKVINKELKVLHKHYSKGKKNASKREPTGFVKPTLISDELAVFLNKDLGIELARTAVSKEIHNYIKSNNLNKGRFIYPDEPLAKILNYTEGVDVPMSYLNLQRFLKHHFIGKKAVDVVDNVVV